MREETKAVLNELIIDLHNQARTNKDQERGLEFRKIADEISDLIKKEENDSR